MSLSFPLLGALFATRPVIHKLQQNTSNATTAVDKVEEAARLADAYDFVMEFPDGFDTKVEVGGKGVQLSDGQKQRIAVARALVKVGLGPRQ